MSKTGQSPRAGNKGVEDKQEPAAKPRRGNDFGQEGTNKTVAVPKPEGAPSEELGNTPHIEKTPYTRG